MDRAVEKYTEHQKRKLVREEQKPKDNKGADGPSKLDAVPAADNPRPSRTKADVPAVGDADMVLSDNEEAGSSGSPDRKRKREVEMANSPSLTPSDGPSLKKLREDELDQPSPPPPPPPPPQSAMKDVITAEQQALREQEEALMRENEEAQRLDDEANLTKDMEDVTNLAEKEILAASNEISQLNS